MHKGYKCYSLNGRTFMTRNVIFDEGTFPFCKNSNMSSAPPIHIIQNLPCLTLCVPILFAPLAPSNYPSPLAASSGSPTIEIVPLAPNIIVPLHQLLIMLHIHNYH